jgi:hypothetical protein
MAGLRNYYSLQGTLDQPPNYIPFIIIYGGLAAFHSLPEMLQTLLMAILGTAFSTQVPDKKDQHEFETMTGCWRCCNDRGFPCLPTCYLCSPMNWTWQAKYSANPARRYHTQEITKGWCHHLIVVRRGCCLELFAVMALHANHHFVYAIAVALIPPQPHPVSALT